MTGVLGISTLQYAPWAFFNYLMPLAVIIMTAIGFLTVKTSDDPDTIIAVEE
jgi:NhaC family Na+:H+ antiporter